MLKERTFGVVWVSPGHGTGVASVPTADVKVSYDGRAVEVRVGD